MQRDAHRHPRITLRRRWLLTVEKRMRETKEKKKKQKRKTKTAAKKSFNAHDFQIAVAASVK